MFYEQSLSKSDIARQLRLSVTHVNRLLREGVKTGVVEIRVKAQTIQTFETELIKAFGLRDARVVASSADPESTRVDLGRAAATLFDEIVRDGATVAVGSGRTLFELASRLPEHPRSISIYPANLIVEQDLQVTGVTANAVATIIWFRSRPSAQAWRLEMFFPTAAGEMLTEYTTSLSKTHPFNALQETLCNLDAYFLGASEFRPESQLARLRAEFSVTGAEFPVVGDIGFNVLDSQGRELDSGLDHMMLRVPASSLQTNAARGKDVVLVAGGPSKAGIISAALCGKLCNILVTDAHTAEILLRDAKSLLISSNATEEPNAATGEQTNLPISLPKKVQN